jgi:two-component system sensor histidine kinase TtrS
MLRRFLQILLLLLVQFSAAHAEGPPVRIGVLSHRGNEATLQIWSPTAEYLTSSIPEHRFEILPLDFDEVDPTVQFGDVDFLLVNPGIYVNMEVRYRVSRIATLNNLVGDVSNNVFGGVIFTRRDRRDIERLEDLKAKRFMAVDETSLGGFQMAWRELNEKGMNPYEDFAALEFGGIHDAVVNAVEQGRVDVGTVRTDILERMAVDGTVDLSRLKVINPRLAPGFLLLRSTRLYPEWPFSKLRHTPNKLAQRVAVALLNMPQEHPAAVSGNYAGWTVPLDYQPVHDLLQELKLPPYQDLGRFTLSDAIKRYRFWLLLALVFLLSMAFMTTWVVRLNRELKKSKLYLERQHELILNSVADGISGVDLDGNSTFVNRAMEQITGWTAEDLIGRNQHQIMHHTHADGSPHTPENCPVYLTFSDNQPRFVSDDVFWKKDGSCIPVEYSSTPIRDEKGKTVGSVVVFRDISQRKMAEEEARQHQLDLAHVARLSTMGEMTTGIAHELNQPLTAIATNAHACIRMLESGSTQTERCADVMEKIAAQAERAGEIIRQLRRFVRKEQPQRGVVDINKLIEGVLLLTDLEARRVGVVVHRDLDPAIVRVTAQFILIEQVILNLIRNAIEAMSDQKKDSRILTIRTAMQGEERVIVTISDTGPGLGEEIRSQLFNPFVTTKPNGMGLGLALSRGIIQAHHGDLYLDSAPGQGAVFRFTLPVDREEDASEQ